MGKYCHFTMQIICKGEVGKDTELPGGSLDDYLLTRQLGLRVRILCRDRDHARLTGYLRSLRPAQPRPASG